MVEAADYTIPFQYRKVFSPEDCSQIVQTFKNYDKNADKAIQATEFPKMLKDMGHGDLTSDQIDAIFKKYDRNKDGVIDFLEFLDMIQTIKGANKDFGSVGEHAKGDAATIQGAVGAQHTYLVEERNVVARLWNKYLEDDEYVKDRFPMVAESDDLFHVMADGLVLIRLLNEIEKDSIDMRTVNVGSNLGIFKVRENINLGLTAAKGKIKLVGIDATAFLDKKPHLILAVCWQIAR